MRPISNRSRGNPQSARHGLGAQTFTAALHAQKQRAARRRQTELVRPLAKRDRPFAEPIFEVFEAGNVAEFLLRFVVLQADRSF